MTWIVDTTALITLGRQANLSLLTGLETVSVLPTEHTEINQEPEATAVERFVDRTETLAQSPSDAAFTQAMTILDEHERIGDVAVIAAVIDREDDSIGVVSDDRRVRAVARGLGADVTGTIGIIVHAVTERKLSVEQAKQLVRDIDRHGFHMTGYLRDTADRLIEEAADHGE